MFLPIEQQPCQHQRGDGSPHPIPRCEPRCVPQLLWRRLCRMGKPRACRQKKKRGNGIRKRSSTDVLTAITPASPALTRTFQQQLHRQQYMRVGGLFSHAEYGAVGGRRLHRCSVSQSLVRLLTASPLYVSSRMLAWAPSNPPSGP